MSEDILQTLLDNLQATSDKDEPSLLPVPEHQVVFGATTPYPLVMADSKTVRLWVELDDDLYVVPLSDFQQLEPYAHEVWIFAADGGIADFFEPPTWGSTKVGPISFGCGREQWAMQEGLIPHQPFLVELYARHYMHETPEGAEGDCESHYEILQKTEANPEEAAKFWEKWAAAFHRMIDIAQDEVGKSHQAMRSRPDLLAIRRDPFWSEGYDDSTPPDGMRITLLSTLKPIRPNGDPAYSDSHYLTSGESTKCRDEQAWVNLTEKVKKHHPQFAHVDLRKLPEYYYGCEKAVVI
jgi:hypothetical protein